MFFPFRPASESRYDLLSLGECMVRLSPPGHGRIELATNLEVWVGGGEYNVACALSRLGLRTAWVGGLVDNPVGRIIENHARQAGVDLSHAVTLPFDGVGRAARIGLNFTEVGTGIRPSRTIYDRGHAATSLLKPGDVDWEKLFEELGVRWFHTGGIFTALSPGTAAVAGEAVEAARKAGVLVSYDLNFRSKLWSSDEAIRATEPLVPFIDCLFGNEEDFQKSLGRRVEGVEEKLDDLPVASYREMVRKLAGEFPGLKAIGTTLREVTSATENNWSAILYAAGEKRFYQGPRYERLIVEDRVGGGDGFVSGLAWSLLSGDDLQCAVDCGTAHGALVQTTRGDTSQVTASELREIARGGSARIVR